MKRILTIFCIATGTSLLAQDAEPQKLPRQYGRLQKTYLKISGGYFAKMGSPDPSLSNSAKEHAKKIGRGPFFQGEIGFRVGEGHYIGLHYSRSSRSGSFTEAFSVFLPGGGSSTFTATIDNTETIQYTGAHYTYGKPLNVQNSVLLHGRMGAGLWNYRTEVKSGNASESVKKGNIGYMLGTTLEVRLAPGVSFTADADLLAGNVEVEGEKESLTQYRIGGGLMFRF